VCVVTDPLTFTSATLVYTSQYVPLICCTS